MPTDTSHPARSPELEARRHAAAGDASVGRRRQLGRDGTLLAMLLAAGLLCGASASARPNAGGGEEPPVATALLAQSGRISLEQAVARVQRATGGRVLDARDEGEQHRVKVLTRQGEVRVVIVDARSGAMR
jgi:uncharacterized membrane protein YkoI